MEQYINLVWKNYTASHSQNSDENFSDDDDNASDLFADNDLHYQIPFWIGVTVISLLLLATMIGTIRYCIHTLCSSHTETEKVALMPPTSPCLSSSVANTNQRQKSKPMRHYLSNDNETSSSSPEQLRDHRSNISIISRHHQTKFDTAHHHYFSPSELRTPVSFRKKIHDIYVLPVSPALSSSSSTTNTDEIIRTNSNTMPIQSRRDIHNNSTFHGIKNDCFTESPQSKNRTLPRLHAGTLRRVPPPSQPPPLPPIISPFHEDKSSFQHQVSAVNLEENQMKKPHPPPVPYRSQKPSRLPISFEELIKQSDFRFQIESSPQNDYAEHAWPNPPESMSTSQLSGPLSIPYDHLVPNIVMHQNNTTTFFHQYRPNEHSMLTESDTLK